MKDREFLVWLHERLTEVHKENPLVDYMHKLRAIIKSMNPECVTPNIDSGNRLSDIYP
jgi:hypothetical protein